LDQLEREEENLWFVDVAKLGSGKSFGELALISDARRAATIKCLTNCSFATLSKADYTKFLKRLEEK
jgi:CRP-like cAMP-binding protein